MRARSVPILVALVLTLGGLAAGALDIPPAIAQESPAPQPPPAPQVESPGPAPNPNAVWIAGHWAWHGKYEWQPGRWETAPPGASYIPGRHKQTAQGWVWEPGRWRRP
jgi:hypothetical protein